MKLVVVLAALLSFTIQSFADERPATWVNVDHRVNFVSNFSFYSCDIAEFRAQDILSQMGAANIEVQCVGGLPDWDQVWLYLKYQTLRSTTEDKATTKGKARNLRLAVDSECDLQEVIVRQVAKKFEATQVKKSGFCNNAQGQLNFDFNVFSPL